MPSLATFQARFGAMLSGERTGPDRMLNRALAVHRNTSTRAAEDALAANYPVTLALVGSEAFRACAVHFVEAEPPRLPQLCHYGEAFARFVAGWGPFLDVRYLDSVAHLERLVTEALFAGDEHTLDAGMLTKCVDLDSRLRLHPAASVHQFDCPAGSLWLAHQPGADPDALANLNWGAEAVLVTRPGLSVDVRVIDAATFAFLTAPTLGEAASAAAAAGGDVQSIFAELLICGAYAR